MPTPTRDGSISLSPPANAPKPEDAFDEDALADKISSGFAAAFGTEDEDDYQDDPQDDNDDYRFSEEDEADNEEDEEQDHEDAGSADDDIDEQDAVDDDAPTISTAHERSLLANHTREEIADLYKNMGAERFSDYAARQHEKRNTETQRMAELGRMAKSLGQPSQTSGTPAASGPHQNQTTPANPGPSSKIEPVSVEVLREKFGDDELIDTFAQQMNAQAAVLNQMMSQQQQAQQSLEQQASESLSRQVESFFADPALKAFGDHYGPAGAPLTPEQERARVEVLEMADALVSGAQFQGRTVSVQDALARAHGALSVEVSEASVRRKIKQDAKKRNRGITARPSRRTATGQADLSRKGEPSDEKELQARTRTRLKQVFG